MTRGTANRVIAVAAGELGTREGPNNTQKYGAWDRMPHGAWCGQFVSWCLDRAGVAGDWRGADTQRYCPTAAARWKAKGRWRARPKRGDLVFFAWGGRSDTVIDHIGIVTHTDRWDADGLVATIEGNAQPPGGGTQGVFRHLRPRSVIAGFGRPVYRPAGPRVWEPGDTGWPVRVWQWIVHAEPDGDYGPKTKAAVAAWQAKHGLPATGLVDRATRRRMR